MTCRRQPGPGASERTDRHGGIYWFHVLGPADGPPAPAPPERPETDPELVGRAYEAMLDCPETQLTRAHAAYLNSRGISPRLAQLYRLRSLPRPFGRQAITAAVARKIGTPNLEKVPGFVRLCRPRFERLELCGQTGIIIPHIDFTTGRILALQIRRDGSAPKGSRYRWLSSSVSNGPRACPAPFLALVGTGPWTEVRVVEGAFKAMVAADRTGLSTLALPGCGAWQLVLGALKQIGARTVRLAFDMDRKTNPAVAQAFLAAHDGLEAAGFTVAIESWPDRFKGLDDYLLSEET